MSNPILPSPIEEEGLEDMPHQGTSTADESPRKPPDDPRFLHSAGRINWNSINFKEAVGRKFTFPYKIVKSWADMEELIKQAFLHVDVIGPHVQEGHYDLIGPDGTILLPQIWEYIVEPGWTIEMRMWPMEKANPRPIESRFPMPPGVPPGVPPGMPPGMRPGQPQATGIRPGKSGYPPPPPRPIWSNGRPWDAGYTGPGVPSISVPPPPSRPPPRIINVGAPPQKKKTKRESLLSWMAGKTAKKESPKENDYDGSSSHNEPLPERSEHVPTASPSSTSVPPSTSAPVSTSAHSPGPMSGGVPHRFSFANETITKHPLSRNVGGRSLNLRPKKRHERLESERPISVSSASSSKVSSLQIYSVGSARSIRRTVAEEDARRLISQKELIVRCFISSIPLGWVTTGLTPVETVNTPTEVLELSAARICRDGFDQITVANLELVKQRGEHAPLNQEQRQAGSSTMTWKHFKKLVMCLDEFEKISRIEFRADDAMRSAVEELFDSIRKKKLDDKWHIKPGTVLRCDTKPGEKVPASVTFISVPYLYPDSFNSTQTKYQGPGICLARRLHEALSSLGSAEEDKRQQFRQNEGKAEGQVLWIGQAWILVGASTLLTYGTIPMRTLQEDSIAIRDQRSNADEEDRVIQIMDQDGRLFYLPADKCKSFYELETLAKDKMRGSEQDLNHCDLSFSLPNEEVLNASKWSSLLNLNYIPTLKVSLNFYSDASTGSTYSGHSTSSSRNSEKNVDTQSHQHDIDDAVSKGSKTHESRQDYLGKKFVNLATVPEAVPPLANNVPQLNSKVPPFLDWRPKAETVLTKTAAERFRERLDEVDGDLLKLYRYENRKTNIAIRQVYEAFSASNIYHLRYKGLGFKKNNKY